jgi:amino acid permease
MSTLYEAKVVKKNQWMRVFELYGVMLVVIMISYAIYKIFKNNEEPAQPNRDEEHLQLVGRNRL